MTLSEKLKAMTWEEMNAWTDGGSLARGEKYLSHVGAPGRFPDGSYVATVSGSDDYWTRLYLNAEGGLEAHCTCPVGYRCKHAVALALVCAAKLRNGEEIPAADPDGLDWCDAQEELAFGAEDEADAEAESSVAVTDADGTARSGGKKGDVLDAYLADLDVTEWRRLMTDVMDALPKVRVYLRRKIAMDSASTTELVAQARKAIKRASDVGYDKWDRDGEAPDYTEVRECFTRLRDAGDVRMLVELGDLLKARATAQFEQSHDEDGEIGSEVSPCMDIVADAVMRSDLDVVEKVRWEHRIKEGDEYCLLDNMDVTYVDALMDAGSAAWSRIADYLQKKAGADIGMREANRVAQALEHAGRIDDGKALWESMLERRGCYLEYAEYLARNGFRAEAERCCRRGLELEEDARDGDYRERALREFLRNQAEQDGDGRKAAGFALDAFLSSPSKDAFEKLKAAAEKVKAWPAVRRFALGYVERGSAALGGKWPVPKAGTFKPRSGDGPFPMTALLVDLAIAEKRADDAWRWFCEHRRKPQDDDSWFGYSYSRAIEVAKLIGPKRPEDALTIWRDNLKSDLEGVGNGCYDLVVRDLASMRPLMAGLGRLDAWKRMVADIRAQYKRRRNLVQKLDQLERPGAGGGLISGFAR